MTEFNEKWITKAIDFEAVKWAKVKGNDFAKKTKSGRSALTTSQLRKFFGELRRIESDYEKYSEEIPMLRVKLAYAVGRDKKNNKNKSKILDFYEAYCEIEAAYQIKAPDSKNFGRMIKLLEAIVAFHKENGGE